MTTLNSALAVLTGLWMLLSFISRTSKPVPQNTSGQSEVPLRNSSKLLLAAALAFAALGALTVFINTGTQKVTYPVLSYDGKSPDNTLAHARFFEVPDKTITELNARFRIKASPLASDNDVFRTTDTAGGTNVELGRFVEDGMGMFLSGRKDIFSKIYDPVDSDQWYFVAISKTMHTLDVRIDKKRSNYKNQPAAIVYNLSQRDNASINAWQSAVGTGYGKKRHFKGEIQNFTLECTYSSKSQAVLYWLDLIKTLNILLLIALITALLAERLRNMDAIQKSAFLEALTMAGPILLVVFPLFDITANYYDDWHNHVWTIGYVGEFFRSNLAFPLTLNLSEYALSAQPIFYGAFFYPLMGIISSVTGAALALRLVVIALFILQYYMCNKLVFRLTGSKLLSNAVSVLVTWAIYPLTNLYNRAAITEFTATTLAFIALCIFLLLVFDSEHFQGKTRTRYLAYFCISVVLCVGTHPITAMLFMLSLLFISMIFLPFTLDFIKRNKTCCIALAVISLVLIFPVAYPVLVNPDLHVLKGNGVIWFSNGIDSWLQRFSPLLSSVDERIAARGIAHVSTPYLDTQVNMCLLFLGMLLFNFARINKEHKYAKHIRLSVFLSLAYFFIANLLSLSTQAYQYLPGILSAVQFCYRMVTYQNIAIFVMIALLLVFSRIRIRDSQFFAIGLAVIMTLSLSSILIKIEHINAVKNIYINTGVERYGSFPTTYYSKPDYTSCGIPEIIGPVENELTFPVSQKPFGRLEQLSVDAAKEGWFKSNIARFRWNKIYVDGKELDSKDIKAWGNYLVLHLDAGKHTLKAVCAPPSFYVHARIFAIFALFALILTALTDGFIGMLRSMLQARAGRTQ